MKFETSKLFLLDGAMGTMIQKSGRLRPGQLPELLGLTEPELLTGIHRAYIEAGSQAVYANTFGVNAHKLRKSGHTVDEVVTANVAAAKRAAQDTGALVALDMGPIGELLEPMGTLTFEAAYDLFAEVVDAGVRAGVDMVAIETMTDLYEAKAALLAAKEHSDLPCLVTMTFDETGRTFTGCTVASMARTLEGLGADAIGLNCSLGPREALPLIKEVCANTRLPVVAKPNAGLPDPVDGHYDLTAEAFAAAMVELVKAGASVIGGCCGTDPTYIRALREAVEGVRPGERHEERCGFVCTPTMPVKLTGVRVIGERINPTGKKRFQQALLENDLDYIAEAAVAQMDAGAAILDVNVGHPGVDEAVMLPRVVKKLQETVDLPLQLDSSNPDALEAGLRVYNGKPAVNSVNGKPETLRRILPMVRKYGAAVVGLTLDDEGLPDSAGKRVAIAKRILEAAEAYGIPREDVWIDCLTLTVSAQQEQAEQTLEAVRRVTHELGLHTVLGVSNISFGLPNRPLMAQAFLIRAIGCGLTLPILNPNQKEMMDAVAACRALSGEDRECREYVARFAQQPTEAPKAAVSSLTLDEAIRRGLRSEAGRLAQEALQTEDELSLVEKCLIPALDKVGEDYERGVVFLPQLLSAAQAAQAVFEAVRTSLASKGDAPEKRGRLILATVHGDIHDIGKNIVRTVLENYGYDVVDLGRDVPPEVIVEKVKRQGIRLVGLSALMTTTLPAMEETIRQLHTLPEPPIIMVGGAVVTPEYAQKMGADYYTRDAKQSVEVARRVLG